MAYASKPTVAQASHASTSATSVNAIAKPIASTTASIRMSRIPPVDGGSLQCRSYGWMTAGPTRGLQP